MALLTNLSCRAPEMEPNKELCKKRSIGTDCCRLADFQPKPLWSSGVEQE
jgi:hypothetical protein